MSILAHHCRLMILVLFIILLSLPCTAQRSNTKENISKQTNNKTNQRENEQQQQHQQQHQYTAEEDNNDNQKISEKDDYMRRRKQKELEIDRSNLVKRTLAAAKSEYCDWRNQPIATLRGEVCGSYYKVLGLDRKRNILEKSEIKKAYRNRSLNVHPDKNTSPLASEAFKAVQNAYECLSSNDCKESYDEQLNEVERRIVLFRYQLKKQIAEKTMELVNNLHYIVSVTAYHVYQTGLKIWELATEYDMHMFGESIPVGRIVLLFGLMLQGRPFLKVQLLSYLIVNINHEIAKFKGLI